MKELKWMEVVNNAYELVELPRGSKQIKHAWVFKINHDSQRQS
jgi:hypothetical protein